MHWLAPQYRILYTKTSQEVFEELTKFVEQSCLYCSLEEKVIAIVVDLEYRNEEVAFALYETIPNALSKINSEQYYIKLNFSQDYIKGNPKLTNVLTIKEK